MAARKQRFLRPSKQPAKQPSGAAGPGPLGLLGILLVAACLRPAITSVGPLLTRIGDSLDLGAGSLGVLGAVPLLAFAGLSMLVHPLARRLGTDQAVLLSLIVLAAAIVFRSLPLPGALWIGTLLLGAGIAVCNVLVPTVVKRDYPRRVSPMTGAYSATMNGFAAGASGLAVPIAAGVIGGWRLALGISAVIAVAAAIVWALRMRRFAPAGTDTVRPPAATSRPVRRAGSIRPPWRSPLAWQVTLHMGLQSTVFYVLATWLPSLESDAGLSGTAAGVHLLIYQAVGIPAGLFVTAIMARFVDQRAITPVVTVPVLIAMVGFLVSPSLMVLWVILAGMGNGCSIAIALSLIGLRSRTAEGTARLSGMAQSLGYLMAAGGPSLAGWLRQLTQSWTPVLTFVIGLTVGQAVFAFLAGRNRYVDDDRRVSHA